jgi:pilus assembly protein CpaB
MVLRRLARSPLVYWVAVALLAVVTGGVVSRLVGEARASAARYGSLRTALVATRSVELGAVLRDADVAPRRVPAAFLPAGWVAAPQEAVGRTVVAPVFAGEPLLRWHLAPVGLKGVAALLPPGTRAVGVPTGSATPPVRKGDTVDLLASLDDKSASSGEPTFPVADGALVVDTGSESATVAVTPEEAERVAFAVTHGSVTLAVSPGPPPAGADQ